LHLKFVWLLTLLEKINSLSTTLRIGGYLLY